LLDSYRQIYDATARLGAVRLWLSRFQTLQSVADHRLLVILKARQFGLTWLVWASRSG
jgi:hypothetical protein